MAGTVTFAPAQPVALVEPVTLAVAKAHLRVFADSQDALIERLIRTARQHLEGVSGVGGILGRALTRQRLVLTLPAVPAGRMAVSLPRPPFVALVSLSYLDAAGAAQVIALDDVETGVDADRMTVQPIAAATWPAGTKLAITYDAGYAAAPEPVVAAMLLLIEQWYGNRSAAGAAQQALPFAVDALLAPYMTHGWI